MGANDLKAACQGTNFRDMGAKSGPCFQMLYPLCPGQLLLLGCRTHTHTVVEPHWESFCLISGPVMLDTHGKGFPSKCALGQAACGELLLGMVLPACGRIKLYPHATGGEVNDARGLLSPLLFATLFFSGSIAVSSGF